MTTAVAHRVAGRSPGDVVMVTLALVHGSLLVLWPSTLLIAMGLWWNANTVSHNFIHNPYFRSRIANRGFSLLLSLILGLPQRLWRDRHLAHHAGKYWQFRFSRQIVIEFLVVAVLWGTLLSLAPAFVLTIYLPGFLVGLLLCSIHGYYEHVGGGTTAYYGRLYNWFFFNDGYHCEHHAYPGRHWRDVPTERLADARVSAWPPVLRWLEALRPRMFRCALLVALEKIVLRSSALQRWVLRRHRRAFRTLLPQLEGKPRIGVIGGGLFPRTALLLSELVPRARLEIIDRDETHLQSARERLGSIAERCRFIADAFDVNRHRGFDVLVVPLAFDGDRDAITTGSDATTLLMHDWIWRRRGVGAVISWLLLKRLNRIDGNR